MLVGSIVNTVIPHFKSVQQFAAVFDGDSISIYPSNAPAQCRNQFDAWHKDKVAAWTNFAVSGSTQVSLRSREAAVDAALTVGFPNVFHVMIGPNDLSTSYSGPSGTGLTGYLADLALYLDNRLLAGYTYRIISTMLPMNNNAAFLSIKNEANAIIRTWVGTHCEGVCDVGANAIMGADTAPANTAYYLDGVHPTPKGFELMSHDLYHSIFDVVSQ
jgi:lysophospholipase L1-like esterase